MKPVKSRLAAVLAADVAGYTRLMQANEKQTIETWWEYRREFIDPTINEYEGRIVKLTGDGFLAEFGSANNALQAAYQIQRAVEGRAASLPEAQQMRFRMGINLGEIFFDDEDVYGDDVNIAARLEGLAGTGSILVSQPVFDQVKRSAVLKFEDLGDQTLKHISQPVRAYRVLGELTNHSCMSGDPDQPIDSARQPDNPNSIAVLPFAVFGDDPEQDFFADGFTEDLITDLSRFRELFVISRNTCFAYKDRHVDLRELGAQLGVAYCLEGSVRRMGMQLRVTAQLIDTASGDHVWAEKYDCPLDELFDVQDQMVRSIVYRVAGQVNQKTLEEARKKHPANMQAYECLLHALDHHRLGGVTREHAEQAVYWINQAIDRDPEYGRAYGWRACTQSGLDEWTGEDNHAQCVADVHRALELDELEAENHRLMGSVALYDQDWSKAEFHFLRALEINPNNPWVVGRIGDVYNFQGDGATALEYQEKATQLDPFLPIYMREVEIVAHYLLGNYRESINVVTQCLHKSIRALTYRVAAQVHIGDEAAIRSAKMELTSAKPDFSIDWFLGTELYDSSEIRTQIRQDLQLAGLN